MSSTAFEGAPVWLGTRVIHPIIIVLTGEYGVTGSSRGLGKAILDAVLTSGQRVVATLRKPEVLADYKDKFGSQYRARWLQERSTSNQTINMLQSLGTEQSLEHDSPIRRILADLSAMGISVENPMGLTSLLPKDEFEDSLEIMSSVRAYFHGMF